MITPRVGNAISRYAKIAIRAQFRASRWQCYRRNFRGDFAVPCLVFVPNPELVKLILTEGESNG